MQPTLPLHAVLRAAGLALGLFSAACGGKSTSDAGSGGRTHSEPLCDGSDAIRFLYRTSGGWVEQETSFTNPHGHQYLAVTGKCEAFAAGDYMEGVRSVTLSAAQASALAKDLGRDQITAWSKYPDQESCPDAGSVSISDGKAQALCSCGCDPGVPSALEAALDKASEWAISLFDQGSPLSGPVAAAAAPDQNPQQNLQTFAWPLSWPITDLPSPWSPGKRIEDATEAATLRQLRGDAHEAQSYVSYVPIESASAERFHLYVRDELPTGVEAALAPLE